MNWVARVAKPAQPSHVATLLALASHADAEGRGAFPSWDTLMEYTGLPRRTLARHVAALEGEGLIRRGDQSLVEHVGRNRRPVVWDLAMGAAVDSPVEPVDNPPSRGATRGTARGATGDLRGATGDQPGVPPVAPNQSIDQSLGGDSATEPASGRAARLWKTPHKNPQGEGAASPAPNGEGRAGGHQSARLGPVSARVAPGRPPVGHGPGEPAPGRQGGNEPPPARCGRHQHSDGRAPCRACGDARLARERWESEQAEVRRLERQQAQRAQWAERDAQRSADPRAQYLALCQQMGWTPRGGRAHAHPA